MIRFTILFLIAFSQAVGQSNVQFKPENMIGNRSYNYKHIISVLISEKIVVVNFSYLDSDYEGKNNIYNIRNIVSYRFYKNWSANIAVGLKNPGFYTTASVQFSQSNSLISYVILTGLTYQNSYTSESFASISYLPEISEKIRALVRATFSFNLDLEGATRGVQQFRLGISQNNLTYGLASNFDQFNYNETKLQNHGFFAIITL